MSCVTSVVPKVERYSPSKDTLVATLQGDEPVVFEGLGGAEVGLIVTIHYRALEHPDGWVVQTTSYEYVITDQDGQELLAFHWHPEWRGEVKFTHLHLQHRLLTRRWGLFENKHLPTGRVALEDVLEMLLVELEIPPHRDDWRETLERTRAQFEQIRG